MKPLSDKMRNALGSIAHEQAHGKTPWVGLMHPKSAQEIGLGDPSEDLHGRTLFALFRRGLVAFDITVRLTPAGRKEVEADARATPGKRQFKVIE